MKRRKTWQILHSFTPHEARYFLRWLRAEWVEKQQYPQMLANYLVQCLPNPPIEQEVWEHLYPSLPYDDARLRKLLRDLSAKLEQFLAIQAFRQDTQAQNLYLLLSLDQRRLPEVFLKQLRRIEAKAEKQSLKDAEFHRYQFQFETLRQRYQAKYEPEKAQTFRSDRLMSSFDAWWVLQRQYLMISEVFNRRPHQIQSFLEEAKILALIQSRHETQAPPLVNLYENLWYLLHEDEGPNSLPDRAGFIAELKETIATWPAANGAALVRTMINYFSREMANRSTSLGRQTAAQLCLELFLLAITEGYLLNNGVLSPNTLRSVINVCLSIPDLPRAKVLLAELLEFIPHDEREEASLINEANIFFAAEDYPKVVKLLATRSFTKPVYEVQARTTILLCHYEIQVEATEWLIGQSTQAIKFVQGRKVSQSIKLGAVNLLKLFRRMLKAYTPAQHQKLKVLIQETHPLSRRQWLLKQVEE